MTEFEEISQDFYRIAVFDVQKGMSIYELREMLVEYESKEYYEACAGIQRAIDNIRFWTMMNLAQEAEDLLENIELNFDKDEDKENKE